MGVSERFLEQMAQASVDIEEFAERIDLIVHKLKFIPTEQRPYVYYLHGIDPVFSDKNEYLDQLITIAGGRPSHQQEADFKPDILIVITDKSVAQLLSELPLVLSTSFWSETPAVQHHNVYLMHHPVHLRQPGAHATQDLEILAEIINPGQFVFGHEQSAWLSFQ